MGLAVRRAGRRPVGRGAVSEHRERTAPGVRDGRCGPDTVHAEELMSQPLVLAIEPDLRQAAIVKRIVREKALADVTVVDSRDAAIEAMRTCMPDVLLLSALLSPRDEDELMAHLKTLDHAGHLQTHTIPQLASGAGGEEERGTRSLQKTRARSRRLHGRHRSNGNLHPHRDARYVSHSPLPS